MMSEKNNILDFHFYRKDLYPEEMCEKIFEVSKNSKLINGESKIKLSNKDVVVVCLVKNGEYYIQQFIEHYNRIGVKHIFFIDNGSTDKTYDIQKKYDNVTFFECRLPFCKYKLAMRIFVIELLGSCNWVLSVDIDEFWEYPFRDQLSLNGFIHYLEIYEYNACVAHQLDLFGDEGISEFSDYMENLSDLRYYDISDVFYFRNYCEYDSNCIDDRLPQFHKGNILSNNNIPVMTRGIRWSLFNISPILSKVPLFKIDKKLVPFLKSSHRVKGAKIADISCVLLHKLLNQLLFSKAVFCVKEGSYYNNSINYKRIVNTLKKARVMFPAERMVYRNVNELVENGFLQISDQFSTFLNNFNSL